MSIISTLHKESVRNEIAKLVSLYKKKGGKIAIIHSAPRKSTFGKWTKIKET